MRFNIAVENCCGDFTKVSTQVFVLILVWNRNPGGYVNKHFVDEQSIGAKGDKFVRGEPTIFAQFMGFRDAA